MGMVLVFPANALDSMQSLMVGNKHILHMLPFEDKYVCGLKGSCLADTLANGGMASNIVGFNNASSFKVMWRRAVRFDATGLLVESTTWSVGTELRDLIYDRLIATVDAQKWTTELLFQYAIALCGPDFCPNQLEYGKRYMLRKLLLD